MKKKLLALMMAMTALSGAVHAEEKSSVDVVSADARLDHTSCLRMITSMTCNSNGNENWASGDCALKMSFRLSSGEIAEFNIKSSYRSSTPDSPLSTAFRVIAVFPTVGQSEAAVASLTAHSVRNSAIDQMHVELRKIAEVLELKDIRKCSDFKNNSNQIDGEATSEFRAD